jgi:hypothetical protein
MPIENNLVKVEVKTLSKLNQYHLRYLGNGDHFQLEYQFYLFIF